MRLLVFGGRNFGYKLEPLTNDLWRTCEGRYRWVPDDAKIQAMWDVLDAYYQSWYNNNAKYEAAPFVIVSGSCPTGADFLAEAWAASRGVPVERYPADWSQGKSAGPKRNEEMAMTVPDQAVAMPGGRGTDDMFMRCGKYGIPVLDKRHDPTLI